MTDWTGSITILQFVAIAGIVYYLLAPNKSQIKRWVLSRGPGENDMGFDFTQRRILAGFILVIIILAVPPVVQTRTQFTYLFGGGNTAACTPSNVATSCKAILNTNSTLCTSTNGLCGTTDLGSECTVFNSTQICQHIRFPLQFGSFNQTSTQYVNAGKTIVQVYIDIPDGQTMRIYFETGFAAGCAAGTNVCYLEVKGTVVSLNSCKLDLSGGAANEAGSVEGNTVVCSYGPVSSGLNNNLVQFDAHNGDSSAHIISGDFVITIY